MSKLDIKNLFFNKSQVGRTIKASKNYYVWEFVLEGSVHKIEIFHSLVSGKKTLTYNGSVLSEDETYSSDFSYSFSIKKHKINIEQKSQEKFELTIDKLLFATLVDDEALGTYKFINKENDKVEDLLKGTVKKSTNPNVNFFDDNDFDFGVDPKFNKKKIQNEQPITEGFNNKQNKGNQQFQNIPDIDDIFGLGSNKAKQETKSGFDDIFGNMNSNKPTQSQGFNNFDNQNLWK